MINPKDEGSNPLRRHQQIKKKIGNFMNKRILWSWFYLGDLSFEERFSIDGPCPGVPTWVRHARAILTILPLLSFLLLLYIAFIKT